MPTPGVADGSGAPSPFIPARTASRSRRRVSQVLAMPMVTSATRGKVILLTAGNAD